MISVSLPVRFTGDPENVPEFSQLDLNVKRTALLLVDCDGDWTGTEVMEKTIPAALCAARSVGIEPIYLYNSPAHLGGEAGMMTELHQTRRNETPSQFDWRPESGYWTPPLAPLKGEATLPKAAQNGFQNSYLDSYLRGRDIKTLLCVGVSFKACLFQTIVGGFFLNYRMVLLRDGTNPPGDNEWSDTVNPDLAEGGWIRLVLTRLIEDHYGYSSTSEELVAACNATRLSH